MRFSFLLVIFLFASPVFAEDNARQPVAVAPADPTANPVDALKQSLHKDAPEPVQEKKAEPVVPTWMSITPQQRRQILAMWQNLPETTRPPFPIFRDTMLDKECKPTPEHAARLTPTSSLMPKK